MITELENQKLIKFRLEIKYRLKDNLLAVNYQVINKDQKDLYFSIGAHPAFYWPLNEQENKEDYYLEFTEKENADRYLLESGLLNQEREKILNNTNVLELQAESFKDFPYLGIWSQSAKAPFICIEPWQGIADSVDSSGQLEEKEGINKLAPAEVFSCQYSIIID